MNSANNEKFLSQPEDANVLKRKKEVVDNIEEITEFVKKYIEHFDVKDFPLKYPEYFLNPQNDLIVDDLSYDGDNIPINILGEVINEDEECYLHNTTDIGQNARIDSDLATMYSITIHELKKKLQSNNDILVQMRKEGFQAECGFILEYDVVRKIESMMRTLEFYSPKDFSYAIAAFETAFNEGGENIDLSLHREFINISIPFFRDERYISSVLSVLKTHFKKVGFKTFGGQDRILMHYYIKYSEHQYLIAQEKLTDDIARHQLEQCKPIELFKQYRTTLNHAAQFAAATHFGSSLEKQSNATLDLKSLFNEAYDFCITEIEDISKELSKSSLNIYLGNFRTQIEYLLSGNLSKKKALLAFSTAELDPSKFWKALKNAQTSVLTFRALIDSFDSPALSSEERLRKLEDAEDLFKRLSELKYRYDK